MAPQPQSIQSRLHWAVVAVEHGVSAVAELADAAVVDLSLHNALRVWRKREWCRPR
jgi:hypothetical protein